MGGKILGCTLRALEGIGVWGAVGGGGAVWKWVEVRTCRRGASLEIDCEGMLISHLWNDAVQNALVDTPHPSVAHE